MDTRHCYSTDEQIEVGHRHYTNGSVHTVDKRTIQMEMVDTIDTHKNKQEELNPKTKLEIVTNYFSNQYSCTTEIQHGIQIIKEWPNEKQDPVFRIRSDELGILQVYWDSGSTINLIRQSTLNTLAKKMPKIHELVKKSRPQNVNVPGGHLMVIQYRIRLTNIILVDYKMSTRNKIQFEDFWITPDCPIPILIRDGLAQRLGWGRICKYEPSYRLNTEPTDYAQLSSFENGDMTDIKALYDRDQLPYKIERDIQAKFGRHQQLGRNYREHMCRAIQYACAAEEAVPMDTLHVQLKCRQSGIVTEKMFNLRCATENITDCKLNCMHRQQRRQLFTDRVLAAVEDIRHKDDQKLHTNFDEGDMRPDIGPITDQYMKAKFAELINYYIQLNATHKFDVGIIPDVQMELN